MSVPAQPADMNLRLQVRPEPERCHDALVDIGFVDCLDLWQPCQPGKVCATGKPATIELGERFSQSLQGATSRDSMQPLTFGKRSGQSLPGVCCGAAYHQ